MLQEVEDKDNVCPEWKVFFAIESGFGCLLPLVKNLELEHS